MKMVRLLRIAENCQRSITHQAVRKFGKAKKAMSLLLAALLCLAGMPFSDAMDTEAFAQASAGAAGRYLCRTCGQHFDSMAASHTRTCGTYMHSSTTYICGTCGGSFSSQSGHNRTVVQNFATGLDHYSCSACGVVSSIAHTTIASQNFASESGYHCSLCGHISGREHSRQCTGDSGITWVTKWYCKSCDKEVSSSESTCGKCKSQNYYKVVVTCKDCGQSKAFADYTLVSPGEIVHGTVACTGTVFPHYYCGRCGTYKDSAACYHDVSVTCAGRVAPFYRCSRCNSVTGGSCEHSVPVSCPAGSWSSTSAYRCSGCGSTKGSGGVHAVSCPGKLVDAMHALRYDVSTNGGIGTPPSAVSGIDDGTRLDAGNPCWDETASKEGYAFVGWNTDQDAHEGLSEITMDSDKTVYAIFRKKVSITLHDIRGTDESVRKKEVFLWNRDEKAGMALPEIQEKTGWTAVGWKTSVDADAMEAVPAGRTCDVSGDADFYAVYKKAVSYPVDTNGDGVPDRAEEAEIYYCADDPDDSHADGMLSLPREEPSREGYIFKGWKDEKGGGALYLPGQDMPVREGSSIVPQYAPISYTVRFHSNNGEGAVTSQDFVYDEAQELSRCGYSRYGYDFQGWSMVRSAAKVVYADGQEVENLASEDGAVVDLYAVYEIHRYEVIYEGCEGAENLNRPAYTVGDEAFMLEAPVKEGYLFLGWTADGMAEPKKEVAVDTSRGQELAFRANWQEIISVGVPAASELTLSGGRTRDASDLVVINHSLLDIGVSAGFVEVAEEDFDLLTQEEDFQAQWSNISHKACKLALFMEGSSGKRVYAGKDGGVAMLAAVRKQSADSVALVCRHAAGAAEEEAGRSIGEYAIGWEVALQK